MLKHDLITQIHDSINNLDGRKIAFVLEGRDASGKGGFIKELIRYDIPFTYVHAGMPTQSEMKNWLSTWKKRMPNNNEIVVFDRSWHTRSWVHPVYNYCTKRQYNNHISRVADWENSQNVEIYKNWISISKVQEKEVLENRKIFKRWKYSESDKLAIENFDLITDYKNIMFKKCPTWNIVDKNVSKKKLLIHFANTLKPI
jgi:polyphosphate kinase 2 (PPK2 family)